MPKTLLLADDSVVIQKLVALSFANEDVELISTDNGDDAITKVADIKPDLVLADVVMPGKSGYEVCEAIRQNPELQHIPVLLLTGTFEAFDAERAQNVRSDGHITKPFEAQALVDRVNELLSRGSTAGGAPAAADAPSSSESLDSSYDFFDDSSEVAEPAAAAIDEGFAFGEIIEPSAASEAPATTAPEVPDGEAGGDRTIALMPEVPELDGLMDAPSGSEPVEALSFGGNEPLPDIDLSVPQGEVSGPVPEDAPFELAADSLADNSSAETILADDLFGETAPPVSSAADEPIGTESAFDFSLDEGVGGDPDPLLATGELLGGLDPGSSAFDVSTSDLDVSLTTPPVTGEAPGLDLSLSEPAPEASPVPAPEPIAEAITQPPAPEPVVESIAEPALETSAPSLMEPEPAPAAFESPAPELPVTAPADSFSSDAQVAAEIPGPAKSSPSLDFADSSKPDLSPMMRERVHETLEKVAWEAFSDLSDSIVREVLKKVESVAWEVIPQMAESLVREEIRRMKDEQD